MIMSSFNWSSFLPDKKKYNIKKLDKLVNSSQLV